MTYEIWDTDSRNVLAHSEALEDVVTFLRRQLEELGDHWIDGITVLDVSADGRTRTVVAEDRAILDLLRVPATR